MILDPGLREQGGHHPAFILALLGTDIFTPDNLSLRVFANAEFTPGAVFESTTNAVEYTAFFKTDFYRYFYESPNHSGLPNFISCLTSLNSFSNISLHCLQDSRIIRACNMLPLFHTALGVRDVLPLLPHINSRWVRLVHSFEEMHQ